MKNEKQLIARSRGVLKFWLVAIVAVLSGCMVRDSSVSQGTVTLTATEYAESEMTAQLANGLDREIHVRGTSILFRGASMWESDSKIECEVAASGRVDVKLFGFMHGQSNWISLPPKSQMKIFIPTTFHKQFKGGRCRIEVRLKDGTTAGPTEWIAIS